MTRQEIEQAITHLHRMEQTLEPFAKLRQVLEAAQQWAIMQDRAEGQKAQIDKDMATLQEKKAHVSRELEHHRRVVTEEHTALTKQLEQATKEAGQKIAEEQKKAEAIKAQTQLAVAELQQVQRDNLSAKHELAALDANLQGVLQGLKRGTR